MSARSDCDQAVGLHPSRRESEDRPCGKTSSVSGILRKLSQTSQAVENVLKAESQDPGSALEELVRQLKLDSEEVQLPQFRNSEAQKGQSEKKADSWMTCSQEIGKCPVILEEGDDFIPDIPVIHDAMGCESEEFGQVVAAAPNYQDPNLKVTTYFELEKELRERPNFHYVDDHIDLKVLGQVGMLFAEEDLAEEDVTWEWERLFMEVSSELQLEWEKNATTKEEERTDGKDCKKERNVENNLGAGTNLHVVESTI